LLVESWTEFTKPEDEACGLQAPLLPIYENDVLANPLLYCRKFSTVIVWYAMSQMRAFNKLNVLGKNSFPHLGIDSAHAGVTLAKKKLVGIVDLDLFMSSA